MVRTRMMLKTNWRRIRQSKLAVAALGGFLCVGGAVDVAAQPTGNTRVSEQPILVHRWEVDPDLGVTWPQAVKKPISSLVPNRFSSTESEYRIAESQKAIRYANDLDVEGRVASLNAILTKLSTPDANEQVQLSLVSAAIKLADASNAPELWEKLRDHNASRRLIEPALVKWKSPVALADWRKRLSEADASLSSLIVAIEGIAALGNEQDLAVLETLLRSDRTGTPLKVVVARAMGTLATSDLESLAEDVTASGIDQHDLIVAELLAQHTTDRARDQLGKVLKGDNDAARTRAYAAISRSFSTLARELAPEILSQPNNQMRQLAVEVLNRFDDPESLRQQATAIGDRNLTIRNIVRENLEKKAQDTELKPVIDETIAVQLKSSSPHAVVQAILLTVALEERDRCPQLVVLLDHPDMDTSITAAWGLQSLVESPDLLELILKHTDLVTQRIKKGETISLPEFIKQSYLFEALGRNRYQPALASLKLYIPKSRLKLMNFTRATAIWAIGKIYEGTQDEAIARQIAGRMLDRSDDDPEDPLVQFTSAVALGFIKAPGSIEQLNKVVDAPPAPIALAREWSLKQVLNSKE